MRFLHVALVVAAVVLLAAPAAAPATGVVSPFGPVPGARGSAERVRYVLDVGDSRAQPETPFQAFDTYQLNVFDFDQDGALEIVTQNDNQRLYVLDAASGKIRAEIATYRWNGWGARDLNGVAIGDVNGNGKPDLVSVNSMGVITAYEYAGRDGDRFRFEKLWQEIPDPHDVNPDWKPRPGQVWNGAPSGDGTAYLADVEGNGRDWVFVQTDGTPGHYAYRGDGTLAWGTLRGDGNSGPAVADIDGDGDLEAVFTTDGGRLIAYDAKSGEEKWSWKGPKWPGSMPVAPALVDLFGDGKRYALVAGRGVAGGPYPTDVDSEITPENIALSNAFFAAIGPDGKPLWVISPTWANPLAYMSPATVDLTGDGVLDVTWLDWNTIGHKPGHWDVTGPGHLFAVDGKDGRMLWKTDLGAFWTNKAIAVADVDGDKDGEIVAVNAHGQEGLSFFDAVTGKEEGWFPFGDNWVASRGPVVANLLGDGSMQIVVPVMKPADRAHCETVRVSVGCRVGEVRVYDLDARFSAARDNNVLFNEELDLAKQRVAANREHAKPPRVGALDVEARPEWKLALDVAGEPARVLAGWNGTWTEAWLAEDGSWWANVTVEPGTVVDVWARLPGARGFAVGSAKVPAPPRAPETNGTNESFSPPTPPPAEARDTPGAGPLAALAAWALAGAAVKRKARDRSAWKS